MIRKYHRSDADQVMELWLAGNVDAHPFISKEYWQSHFGEVREQLSRAEVFVFEQDGRIQGFIGLVNEYIAGIFVDKNCRSRGIGRQLLAYAKEAHDALSLGVYQKNERAVAFYLREGFEVQSEALDEDTGEREYTMTMSRQI